MYLRTLSFGGCVLPKKRLDAVVVHEESAADAITSAKNTLKFEPATLVILNIF